MARRRRVGVDRGSVTVETAAVAPVMVLLIAVLLWALMAAGGQIRCLDAARAGARAAAREEAPGAVLALTRAAAPSGARIGVTRDGEMVRVTVESEMPGFGRLTAPLRGEAVARAEATGA